MKNIEKDKNEWEKVFRLEMAGILGSEGKFAMNSMVELARTVRQQSLEEGYADCKKDMREDLKDIVETLADSIDGLLEYLIEGASK